MKLAILICHLPERSDKLRRLLNILEPQIERFKDQVFYKVHDAGKSIPTGIKRDQLIEQTTSDYFCFIDDDDLVSMIYVDEILKAIESGPDVVTFDGWYTEYGNNRRNFTIRLGSKYYEDSSDPKFFYHRFPNHLAVMKRSAVNSVKFPPIWQMEDFQWADKIRARGLLKTEVHINEFLYHYDCNPVQQRRRK
jgi:hypothetical protein